MLGISICQFQRGQARKSLWIETSLHSMLSSKVRGQARKSLWIETQIIILVILHIQWSGS